MQRKQFIISIVWSLLSLSVLLTGCADHHGYYSGYHPGYNSGYYPRDRSEYYSGYQGFNAGALTGATAGILIDDDNRWRGAVIGGSLGAILGNALTYEPYYYPNPGQHDEYNPSFYPHPSYHSYSSSPQRSNSNDGSFVGGVTGAAVGALIDDGNPWRGGVIGAFLGSFFGGSIYLINSGVSVPVLNP